MACNLVMGDPEPSVNTFRIVAGGFFHEVLVRTYIQISDTRVASCALSSGLSMCRYSSCCPVDPLLYVLTTADIHRRALCSAS
jgi:hypothetical protein